MRISSYSVYMYIVKYIIHMNKTHLCTYVRSYNQLLYIATD